MKLKLTNGWKKALNIVYWIVMGAMCCGLVYFWLAISFISAHIPTGSMRPTLIPGDYLLVCKWQRTDVSRGSFVLFVMPERDGNFYMKRVVGAPGDTVEIRHFRYVVNHGDSAIGCVDNQLELRRMFASTNPIDTLMRGQIYMGARPSGMGWTIRDFGPLIIPRKGMVMRADTVFTRLYADAVKYETGRTLTADSVGNVMLGDSIITAYRFEKNHYFLGGDNVANSRDSRYIGLIPEECLLGKGWFFWNSTDHYTDKTRWRRIGREPDALRVSLQNSDEERDDMN